MIFDQLDRLGHYKGLHPHLDLALDFLAHHDVSQDLLGRYEIAGEHVFYFIQDNVLAQDDSREFEYHKCYLDLHFLLAGREVMRYGPKLAQEIQAYDEATDFAAATSQSEVTLVLEPGNFAVFFPQELHQPNRYAGAGARVRKCVVKVLID